MYSFTGIILIGVLIMPSVILHFGHRIICPLDGFCFLIHSCLHFAQVNLAILIPHLLPLTLPYLLEVLDIPES